MPKFLGALRYRSNQEFDMYLQKLKDGFLLPGLSTSILYSGTTKLIDLTQTPERFYEFLKKISESGKRLSKDYLFLLYKNPCRPWETALHCIPSEVRTTSQFEDYLKQYERYFRIVVKPKDPPEPYLKFFPELPKEANTLEEICLGTDCLELAAKAGIFGVPNYCIKAARRLPSFGEYKQRFSNVTANLSDGLSPEILSYSAPVVALFASTEDEIKRAFSKLQEFWNRVSEVKESLNSGVGDYIGKSVIELVSVLSDYQEYVRCLDALESLWKLCERVDSKVRELYERAHPRRYLYRQYPKNIMPKHYPRIVSMSENVDQLVEYIDAYIGFYEKLPSQGWVEKFESVSKYVLGKLPVVADTIKKYGDFELHMRLEWVEGEHWDGIEYTPTTTVYGVIDIKAGDKVIVSVRINPYY